MRDKRAITPVIAVILLIVMTVGIAAFTFVWMQNFIQSLQAQTQQGVYQLQQMSQFKISYALYDNTTKNLTFIITNVGNAYIDTKKLKVTIEEYNKVGNSPGRVITSNEVFTCSPDIVRSYEDAICWKKLENINLDDYYYEITVSYRGFTTSYTLRR